MNTPKITVREGTNCFHLYNKDKSAGGVVFLPEQIGQYLPTKEEARYLAVLYANAFRLLETCREALAALTSERTVSLLPIADSLKQAIAAAEGRAE